MRLTTSRLARKADPRPLVGFGSSSIVHLATYSPVMDANSTSPRPDPLPCAIKIIDVDRLSKVADIDRLRRWVVSRCSTACSS